MPPLPEAIILVLAPFAPLFSHRVWCHAQVLLLGAMLTPGARTVTAALRVMGLATEHHLTHDHRVLNRATWSARQGSQILSGVLITLRVPAGATPVTAWYHKTEPTFVDCLALVRRHRFSFAQLSNHDFGAMGKPAYHTAPPDCRVWDG